MTILIAAQMTVVTVYILPARGKLPLCVPCCSSCSHYASDGNIRYFEYENDKFEFLSEYKSADQQRGIAFLPKRGVNVGDYASSIKLTESRY
jgi:hypothetical protein